MTKQFVLEIPIVNGMVGVLFRQNLSEMQQKRLNVTNVLMREHVRHTRVHQHHHIASKQKFDPGYQLSLLGFSAQNFGLVAYG